MGRYEHAFKKHPSPPSSRQARTAPSHRAGREGTVFPAALGPDSSRREWRGLPVESSRLLAPRQDHRLEGSCWGTSGTRALLHPRGARSVPGEAATPRSRRSGQRRGRHVEGDPVKITGLVRASSISSLRVSCNSSPCAQGGNNWGKRTR